MNRSRRCTLRLLVTLAGISLLLFAPAWSHAAQPLAPQPAAATWVRLGGPPGGLGYDIRYNFADANTWYVTDAYAGAFMSRDNGLTWLPSNDGIPPQLGSTGDAIPVFSLTVDPLDPQIVWAGTDRTGHIYKSTDGGRSWTEMDAGVEFSGYDSLTFRGFTVDPRSSDTVYAMGELQKESAGGTSVWGLGIGGRVYKTTNGGARWALIWDGGLPSSLARYLWINPQQPDILYVSTGIFDRGAVGERDPWAETDPFGGLGVLKSVDGGESWRVLGKAQGLEMLYIGSLFMHPEDPDILLAAAGHIIQGPSADTIMQARSAPGGVYRTTDGGEHWTKVMASSGAHLLEGLTAVEICPPPYASVAYAGSDQAIYRSEDAGVNWTLVASGPHGWGPPGVEAGWPIDLQCDPRDPDRLFANNYGGGNFLSEDGGRTWRNASQGYTGAQVLQVAVDPTRPGIVYAAGRSGLWRADDGGTVWTGLSFAAPEFQPSNEFSTVAADPARPDRILSGNRLGGVIQESTDRGMTWHHLWPPLDSRGELAPPPLPAVAEIVFAPSDPSLIYAAYAEDAGCLLHHEPCGPAKGVAISPDGGDSWTFSSDANLKQLSVADLAVDPRDPHALFAATENGLFKSSDGGATWALLTVAGNPANTRFRAVAIDPGNGQHVLAAVDGAFGAGGAAPGIYRSADGGGTWLPAYAGLPPETSIHHVVFDPANPQFVYASDFFSGMYRSGDGGASWTAINDGLRMRAVTGLSISADGQHLYVATNGEGVFRLDLNGQPPEAAPPPAPVQTDVPQVTPSTPRPATPTPAVARFTPPSSEPSPTPASPSAAAPGICGTAAALPLALAGLASLRRRRHGTLQLPHVW